MKLHLDRDELWPYMYESESEQVDNYYIIEVEVPDELAREWQEITVKFLRLNEEISNLYEEERGRRKEKLNADLDGSR